MNFSDSNPKKLMARTGNTFVNGIDREVSIDAYKGGGRPADRPRIMTKILLLRTSSTPANRLQVRYVSICHWCGWRINKRQIFEDFIAQMLEQGSGNDNYLDGT